MAGNMDMEEALKSLNKPELLNIATSHIQLLQNNTSELKKAMDNAKSLTKVEDKCDALLLVLEQVTNERIMEQLVEDMKKAQLVRKNRNRAATTTTTTTVPPTTSTTSAIAPLRSVSDSDSDASESIYSTGRTHRVYKLPPNTPIFQSKGIGVDEWFFVFETALEVSNIPKSKILAVLVNYLQGTPLQLLIKYTNDGSNVWTEFKKILKDNFLPHDHQRRLKQQLIVLKQTESVDSYNKRFLSLTTQISDLTISDELFYYTEGLHPNSKFQVLSQNPTCIEDDCHRDSI